MPDDTEGPPNGRTDPGSGLGTRIGPLPIGMWILVGGGILVGVWWFRSHQSSSPGTSTDPNATLPGNPSFDITTLAGLLAAMQNLANQNGQTNVSPPPPTPTTDDLNPPTIKGIGSPGDFGLDPVSLKAYLDWRKAHPWWKPPSGGISRIINPMPRAASIGISDVVSTTHTHGGSDTQSVSTSPGLR